MPASLRLMFSLRLILVHEYTDHRYGYSKPLQGGQVEAEIALAGPSLAQTEKTLAWCTVCTFKLQIPNFELPSALQTRTPLCISHCTLSCLDIWTIFEYSGGTVHLRSQAERY